MSSKRQDSIPKQNRRSRITWARKSELRRQRRPEFAPEPGRRERNFWMRRQGDKNRHQNARTPTETKIRELSGRESPQKRPILRRIGIVRFAETGWWWAQSYANPSQRRFHTGNRGNPLFSAFFSQNGEFKSKGFRFPCVLSVGFRAMWRPATARAMWRPATVRGRLWALA